MTPVLVISFIIFLVLNVPVAFSLAFASLLALAQGGFPMTLVIQRMTNAVDSFILLAVPFFMLAGNLMSRGGISKNIIDFADSLVGFIQGGLAQVNIVTSMFFAGMTGAAVADTSAIGSILMPPMLERGYDRDFTTAVTAASSTIGVIIPPSIPMVIYGVVASVSVGRLFLGGFIPGVLIGLMLMIISYVISIRRGYQKGTPLSLRKLWINFRKSILALFMPVIILGGILFGVFTPTEAAVAAVIYALLVSMCIYRTLTWKDLPKILIDSAITTAVVMLMIAAAFLYGWIITRERIPVHVANMISTMTVDPIIVLLLISALYLIAGTILDLGANIIMLVPVLLPAVRMLGIDPVHFGVVTVMALSIGLITPPVGACLFVACGISKTSIPEAAVATLPFIFGMLCILFLTIIFPGIVLWIPNTFMN